MQDYQLLVLQEGEVDMFQYFSTILYVHFGNYRLGRGNQCQGWEIPIFKWLMDTGNMHNDTTVEAQISSGPSVIGDTG